MRSPFLSLFLLASLAAGVAAQVTPIRGSGCPGAAAPAVRGTPAIGTTLGFAQTCDRASLPVLLLGTVARPTPLDPPLVCSRVTCSLDVLPLVAVTGLPGGSATVAVPIPPDRSLVGSVAVVQGLCLVPSCLVLGQALAVAVTR